MRAFFTGTIVVLAMSLQIGAAFAATMTASNENRGIARSEARQQASLLCALEHKEFEEVRMEVEKDGNRYTAILTYRCV
jgi:hypothetical protein